MKRCFLMWLLAVRLMAPVAAASSPWETAGLEDAFFPVAAGYRAVCMEGTDAILTVPGAPAVAVEDCTVEYLRQDGNTVALRAANGSRLYRYEGLCRSDTAPRLQAGSRVAAGEVVGITAGELLRVRLYLQSGRTLVRMPAGTLWAERKEHRSTVVYDGSSERWAALRG